MTCDIDMQMRMTLDAALYELSWEGTVCGHSVDDGFTLEAPSSPTFGDITFTPSFENIGSARSTQLTVRNVGSTELGPVQLGVDAIKRTTMPDSLCSTIGTDLVPGSIAFLAPDEAVVVDVTVDTQNVDIVDCPAGQYDADLFAAVSGTILGGATIRFDWDGTPP